MYDLTNMCFVCLKDTNKMQLVHLNKEDYRVIHVLPEIALEPGIPIYICPTCHAELLSFSTFKKHCLENYSRWKHYIKLLQESGNTCDQSFSVLQIQINNIKHERQHTNFIIQEDTDIDIKEDIDSEAQDLYQQLLSDIKNESDSEEYLISGVNKINQDETKLSDIENGNANSFCKRNIPRETKVKDTINLSNTKSLDSTVGNIQVSGLNENINKTSGIKDEFQGFECNKCGKKILRKWNLQAHLKRHAGIEEYQCSICDKKFVIKSTLNVHMKTHEDIRNYHCSICDKKFVYSYRLKSHMRTHAGVKNFQCSICDKKFLRKFNLIGHLRRHAGIKNFQCYICGKMFGEKHQINLHLKMHVGIKDIQCTICDKKFLHQNNLQKHMKRLKGRCGSKK